jgi:flagellar secretion chaperone FliS
MVISAMPDNPYSKSLEARILSATPMELVVILYDEAINAVRAARGHLAVGNIRARSRSVSRATSILIELDRALNFEAGGELSRRLAGIYAFMRSSLTESNVRQTDEGLAITERLLVSLREAWFTASGQPAAGSSSKERSLTQNPAFLPGAIAETVSALRSWSA